MRDRATALARNFIDAVGDVLAVVHREVDAWVTGGDVTVILVLSGIALIALFVLVAPRRRRY